MAMLSIFYEPNKRVSYRFLLLGYASLASIGLFLFIMEKLVQCEELVGKGYWLIFTPFVPCFLWSRMMYNAAQTKSKVE